MMNAINNSWTHQVGYVFPAPALVPLLLSKFLVEHVTAQFRLLILVVLCWMKAPWLPIVLNMLEDILWHCPVIIDLNADVSVGQVLKDLPSWHLTLWLLRDMCCTGKSSLPQSVRQWWGKLKHLQ